jgi:hypothetical protein
MERGKLYNVKRNTWHTILHSHQASVFIVENHDTGERNTQDVNLSMKQRRLIIETA